MKHLPHVGARLAMVLGCCLLGPVAAAAETDANYGREARENTPIIGRDPTQPLSDEERIHHALSRLTFGVTSQQIAEVQQMGLETWLKEQLQAQLEEPADLLSRLSALETLELTNQEIVSQYNPPLPSLQTKLSPEELRRRRELSQMRDVPRNQLKDAVLLRAVLGSNQVREVLSDFWRSHFNVDVSKANVRFYATQYERDVIRGETLGNFRNMLNKVARDPAMLVYLDNYISRGASREELIRTGQTALMQSRDYGAALEAIDIVRMRGLNENYARELMELHTLGVDNFYTQEDVINVAEALTGWTVAQDASAPIAFAFRPDMHQTGPRAILGRMIPANPANPEMEGQAVLELLLNHPGTAQFICYKLCRYLVNDDPPPELVTRAVVKFRQTRGNLPQVYLAIVNDPEFYNPRYYQAKFKRPLEFVTSALRVTGAEITDTGELHQQLLVMGEPIYQCEDPTGYYDQADAWRDPGVMATRWQFGLGLAMGWIRGVKIPDSYWSGLEPNNPLQWKEELTARVLPGGHTQRTDEALDAVIARYAVHNPRPEQLGRYIVGILLGSPEFQRQ